jgi:hypothetical protein
MQKPSTDFHFPCRSPVLTFLETCKSGTDIECVFVTVKSCWIVRYNWHQVWSLLFDEAGNLQTKCEPMKWDVFVFCFQVVCVAVYDVTALLFWGAIWNRSW